MPVVRTHETGNVRDRVRGCGLKDVGEELPARVLLVEDPNRWRVIIAGENYTDAYAAHTRGAAINLLQSASDNRACVFGEGYADEVGN